MQGVEAQNFIQRGRKQFGYRGEFLEDGEEESTSTFHE